MNYALLALLIGLREFASLCALGSTLQDPAHDTSPGFVLESRRCGVNAVYMFLVLNEIEIERATLAAIPVSHAGTSLLDLRRFCEDNGMRVCIRKLEPIEYSHLRLPAILHSWTRNAGHFYVAHDLTQDGLVVFDGTTGEEIIVPSQRADDFFSGYVLFSESKSFFSLPAIQVLLASSSLMLFFLLRPAFRRSRLFQKGQSSQ